LARFLGSLIRISAFVRKEVAGILRQPMLVVTLILGPFLILLLFGLGYSAQPFPLRTLFVVPGDSILRPYLEANAGTFVKQIVYEGMTPDEELALAKLQSGQIDVVIVIPDAILETVQTGQQVVLLVYHDEIDPIRVRYATSLAQVFAEQANQRILRLIAEEGQREASTLQPDVEATKRSADALRQAMESDDPQAAQQHLDELNGNLTDLESALLVSGLLLGRLKEMGLQNPAGTQQPGEILADLQRRVESLRELERNFGQAKPSDQVFTALDRDLVLLDTALQELRSIDSRVLVTPFRGEAKAIAAADITLVDYYVPGVIAVLLQHLCITFGALSIIGERRSGNMELFQASPLSAFEVLAGKYLSYLLFTVVLTGILTGLLILTIHVPMQGSWTDYALAVVALLFASLGFGFFFSLLAQTRSQAVQYSMLALLTSVFFTGFFLSLEMLRSSVRVISRAIPATYAIWLLQDIMLRGRPVNLMWVGVLTSIGFGLFLVTWLLLRRAMVRI
jgi:ABC-2 type transport system permease protein